MGYVNGWCSGDCRDPRDRELPEEIRHRRCPGEALYPGSDGPATRPCACWCHNPQMTLDLDNDLNVGPKSGG